MLDIYFFQTYFFLDVNNSRPVQEVFTLPLGMLTFLKMVLPSLTRYLRCPGTNNYPTAPPVPRNVWGVAPLPWGTSLLSKPFAFLWVYATHDPRLHQKGVQPPYDFLSTPTWPPFHCFRTPIWPPWRHVKMLYSNQRFNAYVFSQSQIRNTFCSFTDHFLRPVSIW